MRRTLAELSYQVESSTKEFSRLQEKLEQGHRRDLEEKEEALKAREDSLKGEFVLNDAVAQLHVAGKGSAGYVCTCMYVRIVLHSCIQRYCIVCIVTHRYSIA